MTTKSIWTQYFSHSTLWICNLAIDTVTEQPKKEAKNYVCTCTFRLRGERGTVDNNIEKATLEVLKTAILEYDAVYFG
jgi:hypothetical protein